MSDVEWYLESNGVRAGPFSARQIIDKMKSGQVAQNALVTTPRMQGDWVTVKDLAEAYDELNLKQPLKESSAPKAKAAKKKAVQPVSPAPPAEFQPPPRPVEQLEASKLIILKPEAEQAPDPTNSLFQAMQHIRDKNQQRTSAPIRDQTGEPARSGGLRITGQTLTIATVILLLGILVYGIQLMRTPADSAPAARLESQNEKRAPVRTRPPARTTLPAASGNRLLSEGGAVRTAPPVARPQPPQRRDAENDAPRSAEGYRRREEAPEPARPNDHFEEIEKPPEPNADDAQAPAPEGGASRQSAPAPVPDRGDPAGNPDGAVAPEEPTP